MFNIKPGDVVSYTPFGGGERLTQIVEREADVKNGQPGFTGNLVKIEDDVVIPIVVNGISEVWGYDRQITRIVRRSVVSS